MRKDILPNWKEGLLQPHSCLKYSVVVTLLLRAGMPLVGKVSFPERNRVFTLPCMKHPREPLKGERHCPPG